MLASRFGVGASRVAKIAIDPAPIPSTTEVVMSWSALQQTMDGFGVSDPQFYDTEQPSNGLLSDSNADLLFSTTSGAGLSLLGVGIQWGGGCDSNFGNATKAAARGARIWGRPWTPPAASKDNGSLINGGHLLSGSYGSWSDTLAAFQAIMQAGSGTNVYAISVQNEPDYSIGYVSCLYTNAEMVAFVKVLGPKLAALSPPVKLIAGGYSSWDNLPGMVSAIEADSTALAATDYYASNQYFGTVVAGGVKPLWQTEWSTFDTYDGTMTHGLLTAKKMHSALVTASASAWMYWWTIPIADNEGLFGPSYEVPKRLWVMGNYSKYVRPGWRRVTIAGGPAADVYCSAYRETSTGKFAIVIINDTGSTQSFGLSINGATPGTFTPHRTSSTEDLADLTGITPTGVRASVTVAASSVTTFTGTAN